VFETAQLGRTVDKKTFAAREPEIREELLDLQLTLRDSDLAVVIVIAGAEGAGKGETVNLLLNWLDSRGIETHALGAPTEEELERPEYFRFWRRLPARGRIGIFFGSWYTRPISTHSLGELEEGAFEDALRRIVEFERMLADEGVLLIKLWMHITKKQQKARFKALEANPDTAWRVTKQDWRFHATYDQFITSASRAIRRTDTGHAPWHIIEAADARYRHLAAAETVRDALAGALGATAAEAPAVAPPHPGPEPPAEQLLVSSLPETNVISRLDLTRAVPPEVYRRDIIRLQDRIGRLARQLTRARKSAVFVFEGPDAAGKGGVIRRLTQAVDARFYEVIPISSPTDEERSHPYLWRFWRRLPRHGHLTIFDRSWYGRVLVERVEGFAPPTEWRRAYSEINAFEEQLVAAGSVVAKFWLAISKDEQLVRFQDREQRGYKRYKLTPEDWRNREKWDAYVAAACDMFERTSSEIAPWTLVEANDKYHARLKVLRTVEAALEAAVGG
jgi:polyphosphate:AMP phosphotransferase